MELHEDFMLLVAREKIADAERRAEELRAIRGNRPGKSLRARLGWMLIGWGRWILGESVLDQRPPAPLAHLPPQNTY